MEVMTQTLPGPVVLRAIATGESALSLCIFDEAVKWADLPFQVDSVIEIRTMRKGSEYLGDDRMPDWIWHLFAKDGIGFIVTAGTGEIDSGEDIWCVKCYEEVC